MAFFDKTGTLTAPGMSLVSVECVGKPGDILHEVCIRAAAVCQTLTRNKAGELVGNPIDRAAFAHTGARLLSAKGDVPRIEICGESYSIEKSFEFDNERQTQSVIFVDARGARFIAVKGSPEAISGLCLPYTIPETFQVSAHNAAKAAIYQLAIAVKSYDSQVDVSLVSRDEIESKLFFGGFLNFRNSLCHEAPEVLQELSEALIPTAMITGDNVLAGVAIAREAGMIRPDSALFVGRKLSMNEIEWINFDTDIVLTTPIEEILRSVGGGVDLAITGEAWRVLCNIEAICVVDIAKHIRVFGRCSPTDKVSVVSKFAESGCVTLMCGDGQNDCGSLKMAHVGIALSNAEASIVAPFTALDKKLTAVTAVLREARCTTASALASYSGQYHTHTILALHFWHLHHSPADSMFVTVAYILYGQLNGLITYLGARLAFYLSDWCWVALEGVVVLTVAFSLPLSKASSRLSVRRPMSSLLCVETVRSIVGNLVLNYVFMAIAFGALWYQDWFQCRRWDQAYASSFMTVGDDYEASVLFLMATFQAIATPMSMNFGYTFRQSWFKNYVFVCLSSTWMICVLYATLSPSTFSCIFRVNCSNEVSAFGGLAGIMKNFCES
jgi:magnesium-transporting ATPase (P-type)